MPGTTLHEVAHRYVVAAAEAFPVIRAHRAWDARMTKLVAVIDVGTAVIAKIFAGAFNCHPENRGAAHREIPEAAHPSRRVPDGIREVALAARRKHSWKSIRMFPEREQELQEQTISSSSFTYLRTCDTDEPIPPSVASPPALLGRLPSRQGTRHLDNRLIPRKLCKVYPKSFSVGISRFCCRFGSF